MRGRSNPSPVGGAATPRTPAPRALAAPRALVLLRALVATLLLLLTATPASAHDGLLGSDPADGATLTTAPGQVVLTFSGDQLAVGSAVVVTGPDGGSWSTGESAVDGATLTQPLAADLPAGAFTVAWRSVAGDGHPIEGSFAFSVADPADPEPSAGEATAAPEPTGPGVTAAPVPDPTGEDSDGAPAAEPGDEAGPSSVTVGWIIGAIAVAAAAALAVVAARRARG